MMIGFKQNKRHTMNQFKTKFSLFNAKKLFLILTVFISVPEKGFGNEGFVNDLRGRGFSLIPAPKEALLKDQNIILDKTWKVFSDGLSEDIAIKIFKRGFAERLGTELTGEGLGEIHFEIRSGIIKENISRELKEQGYKLEISDKRIRVIGNGKAGLYYGTQSLLQLLKPHHGGLELPTGIITDWPDLNLRSIHWDTKNHQDRIETLKRFLDQAGYYKINTILFEMEDKYEYPSHPVIGVPGAFTKSEMHELSAYALERYIQIVPVIQAPSHMAYVLKHEEFAHLRADGMNYQACVCDEGTYQLIFDMYQDMIDATPGMNFFYISTDELYYAGICDKCPKEYNDINRSQTWVDFTNRAAAWLKDRGRRPLAYVMFPLLMKDIVQLPSYLIAPIRDVESKEWIELLNQTGLEQLSYSPLQGAEWLFPNYFRNQYRGRENQGRLADAAGAIQKNRANKANLIGNFAGTWDDAGLHNETFWLGWVVFSQYAWSIDGPGLDQSIADFFDSFYGYNSPNLLEAYRLLQEGARYYESLWDIVPSKERESGYGSSHGKGIGVDKVDFTLQLPPLPTVGDINIFPEFRKRYELKIKQAEELIRKNDKLIGILQESLSKVLRNRYNLEVLLSIAYLERHTMNTVINLAKTEDLLVEASAARLDFPRVVSHLVEAHKLIGKIQQEQTGMWSDFNVVWEKSRFPKDQDIGDKKFVFVLDDVKDHFAARRRGLEYMLAPFERMQLNKWKSELEEIIIEYATAKNVPIKGFEPERLED